MRLVQLETEDQQQARYPARFWRGAFALVAALAITVTPFASVSGQADFGVLLSPQLAQLTLKPASHSVLEFQLANTDRVNPLRVRAFISDIRQGARGQYLLSDTTTSYSCASWLELRDTLIEVPPGQNGQVNVYITVPPRAAGGGYGAVVFEMLPPEKPREGQPQASATYQFQLPGFVEITVDRFGTSVKRLRAGDVEIQTAADNPDIVRLYGQDKMLIATEIENSGNVLLEVNGRLFIRDQNNKLVKLVPLGAGRGAILPGTKTSLRSIIKTLRPGKYSLRAIVQYGGYSPAVTQASFEVGRSGAAMSGTEYSVPLELVIRPEDIRLKAPSGSFRTFGLSLANRESFPVEIDIQPGQFYYDVEGTRWTVPYPDSGRTLAPWLEFEPRSAVIAANRQQSIRATIRIPDSVSGGYYAALIVTARPSDTTGEQAAGTIPAEVDVPIHLTVPPDLEYAGQVDAIQVDYTMAQGVTLKPLFRNTGNIHTTAKGTISIEKWAEHTSAIDSLVVLSKPQFEEVGLVSIEADSTWILPGERRLLTSQTIERMPPGRYRAITHIIYHPGSPELIKEKEFVIKATDQP